MSAINKKSFTPLAIILCFGFLCFMQTACKNASQKGTEFTLVLEEDQESKATKNNIFNVTITSDQEINLEDFTVKGSLAEEGAGTLYIEKNKPDNKKDFNTLTKEESLSKVFVTMSEAKKSAKFRLRYNPKDTATGTKCKLTVTATHKDGTPQKKEVEFEKKKNEKKQKNKKKQKKK